jgi:hypothetical protein
MVPRLRPGRRNRVPAGDDAGGGGGGHVAVGQAKGPGLTGLADTAESAHHQIETGSSATRAATCAFAVVDAVRAGEPDLFDAGFTADVTRMLEEAVEAEMAFAEDVLSGAVSGLPLADMRQYLRYVADSRLADLGLPLRFGATNPFPFMALQDVAELSNFFERTVSAYQVGVNGTVSFDEDF